MRFGSTFGLSVLAVVGGVFTVVATASSRSDERAADVRAATAAAERLSTALTAVTSSVAGVDGIAADGRIEPLEFETFASAAVAASGLDALAYVERVTADERADWERTTGVELKDTDGEGGFAPSGPRPLHAVVRYVEPLTDQNRSVVGFDIASDPIRAEGVRQAELTVGALLVGPIRLATSARPGLFLVQAIRDPSARVIGYVASGITLDSYFDGEDARAGVTVVMDGSVIAGDSPGGSTSTFGLAGRTFTVSADVGGGRGWLLPLSLAISTAILSAGALVSGRQARRERQRDDRTVRRSVDTARLAEDLVAATSTDAVIDLVVQRAGPIVGARHTNIGRRIPSDPTTLEVIHDAAMVSGLAGRSSVQALDADLPLPEAVRKGTSVFVADRREYEARYPDAMDDVVAAGIHAVCCVPLGLGGGGSLGVIGFAFTEPCPDRDRQELEGAATLVAQLAGRAYERVRAREIVQERVDLLSEFARSLTVARSTTDVEECVARLLPALLDVDAASVVTDDQPDDDDTRTITTRSPAGERLALRRGGRQSWSPIEELLVQTVVDLVGGALSRARLHDQEQAVLVQLQNTLLTPPGEIDGFDIAVGYRSALETVGIGGDWYTVIDSADSVYVVIGDVAGHGPGAVALMAEVKTVMRHLLTGGTPLRATIDQAHQTLTRRGAFASACVIRFDKVEPTLEYVNAGHLPLVLIGGGRTTLLADVHRPWLGVEPDRRTGSTLTEFAGDSLLLAYTDGLVEQRGELIDVSIRERFGGVDGSAPVQQVVDDVIRGRLEVRDARTVDDDIAIVAVRRR